MSTDLKILCLSAIAVGVIHTLPGPDHDVPLVAMSHEGGWRRAKTFGVTVACGLGHVAGAIVVGAVALAFLLATVGTMVAAVAALRCGLAAWPIPVTADVAHVAAGLTILACGVLMRGGF